MRDGVLEKSPDIAGISLIGFIVARRQLWAEDLFCEEDNLYWHSEDRPGEISGIAPWMKLVDHAGCADHLAITATLG